MILSKNFKTGDSIILKDKITKGIVARAVYEHNTQYVYVILCQKDGLLRYASDFDIYHARLTRVIITEKSIFIGHLLIKDVKSYLCGS
jgi:hypothetical protein